MNDSPDTKQKRSDRELPLHLTPRENRGPLAWFAGNRVAANLLMLFVIMAGLLSLARMNIEIFPELNINFVIVNVPYLGATPEEVEKAICTRVEEAVKEVDGVEQIRSIASEGSGMVAIELADYTDENVALDDIKSAVDRITTFPEEAEEPVVSLASNRTGVMTIALYGDASRRTLKETAEQIRDELTTGDAQRMVDEGLAAAVAEGGPIIKIRSALGNAVAGLRGEQSITTVNIQGLPPYEISIEISEEALRRYGLTFEQVSNAVRDSSLDLPAGTIKAEGGELLVRTTGQRYRGREFEQTVIHTRPDGTALYLSDVATVIDGFEDLDIATRFDGKPAVLVDIYRVGDQGALELAETVHHYIEVKNPQLPNGLQMSVYNDRSTILQSRINLLLRNAAIGLALVFGILALFLDLRLAFWTTMGIPMSFLGAFFLLPQVDVTVNMISLFAFIVVLGIVVDDAIVVGENVFAYRQKGMKGYDAAVRGVQEMAAPVTMAILTTIAAFMPLVLTEGVWGQILRVIPIVVISVVLISLVEALLVLPAHLSHGKLKRNGGPVARVQRVFRDLLDKFIDRAYRPSVALAVRWRYLTISLALAMLIVTMGLVIGGRVKQEFFPEVEADNMIAALSMPQGTPVERTAAIIKRIEDAAEQVRQELQADPATADPEGRPLFKHVITTIGGQPMTAETGSRGGGAPEDKSGAHIGEVNIELLDAEARQFSGSDAAQRWRDLVGEVPGATSLTFTSRFFSSDAVSIELSHRDPAVLDSASEYVKDVLNSYSGVTDVADNFIEGKAQVEVVGVTPLGEALGVRTEALARQLRHAIYGAEAQRIQRGRDEVKVMVRYPEAERKSLGDIENMRVRLPDGTEVPFLSVAVLEYGRSYAAIHRTDRRRTIGITAEIDKAQVSSDDINQDIRTHVLPVLAGRYPGISWNMEGEEAERNDAMGSLKVNFIVALLAIYALLAVQFRSYIQPVIIMTAIPFGIVGAVLGHMSMAPVNLLLKGGAFEGIPLSFMSFFGIVALSGVVVNDSLIMVDLINRERKRRDADLLRIIEDAGARRFRPILLTTLTTFCGLMPMILETSLQAQFLIPMAVSLGFGVLFATAITLILVPSLYRILEDFIALFGRLSAWWSSLTDSNEATATSPPAAGTAT